MYYLTRATRPSVTFQWSLPEIKPQRRIAIFKCQLIQANNEKIIDTMHHYDQ